MIRLESTSGNKALFGTLVQEDIRRKHSQFSFFKSFQRIQSVRFWLIAYLVSAFYYFFIFSNTGLPAMIGELNFIIFPFSVYIVGKITNRLRDYSNGIGIILHPSFQIQVYFNLLLAAIFYLLKYFFYLVVWAYSYALGIIGIIFFIRDVKNLSK